MTNESGDIKPLVTVLTAHHSDGSGFKLLGVFNDGTEARKIERACQAVQGMMTVVAKAVPLDTVVDLSIFPEPTLSKREPLD